VSDPNTQPPNQWVPLPPDDLPIAPLDAPAAPGSSSGATQNASSNETFFEFRDINKGFDDRMVLHDVSFVVKRGQTCVIMGRSGVGKSVTLKILMGFLKPDSGQVFIDGEDVTNYSEAQFEKVRLKVTMVFQSGALFDSLTVRENIAFPLEQSNMNPDDIDAYVEKYARTLEVDHVLDKLPGELSTGLRRAVAIARALAQNPEAILYDEPTTMVDPIMGRSIGDLIQRLKLQLGITSIVVTHDMRFAIRLADLVLFLDSGTARFFGTIHEFLECTDPHVQQFFTLDAYVVPQPSAV